MRVLIVFGICLLFSGCSWIRHELQPHRLWRLNYYDPPNRGDGGLFSVSDPLDRPVPQSPETSKSDDH